MSDPNPPFCFHSQGPDETWSAAHRLARVLPASGAVLSLIGNLGVGKTHFVKGLAEGLGFDAQQVTSPTFAIVNEYTGSGPTRLVHMDFYRLESEIALLEVGFIDLLEMQAVLAIEWGDRFPKALPADHIELYIERISATPDDDLRKVEGAEGDGAALEISSRRDFRAVPRGSGAREIIDRWRSEFAK